MWNSFRCWWLSRKLGSDSPGDRAAAVRALSAIPHPQLEKLLLAQLHDVDLGVQRLVIRSLRKLGVKSAIAPLLLLFHQVEDELRAEIDAALQGLGCRQHLAPHTVEAEPNSDEKDVPSPELRDQFALEAQPVEVLLRYLQELDAAENRDPLFVLFNDDSQRMVALRALGAIADERCLRALLQFARHDDRRARLIAVAGLTRLLSVSPTKEAFGELPQAPQILADLLAFEDPFIRRHATRWLAILDDERVAAPLSAALLDVHESVRCEALRVLASRVRSPIVASQFLDLLVALLKDTSAAVRLEAVRLLANTSPESIVDVAMVLLTDVAAEVREATKALLLQHPFPDLAAPLFALGRAAFAHHNVEDLRTALAILCRISDSVQGRLALEEHDTQMLGHLLTHADERVLLYAFLLLTRTEVAGGGVEQESEESASLPLAEIVEPDAATPVASEATVPEISLAVLVERLLDPRVPISHAALDQLLDHPDVADLHAELTPLLRDAERRIRKTAIDALRRLYSYRRLELTGAALQAVVEALADESAEVRQDAAHLLAHAAGPQCVELLLAALNDRDWAVRCEALVVTRRMRKNEALRLLETLCQDSDIRVRNRASNLLHDLRGVSVAPVPGRGLSAGLVRCHICGVAGKLACPLCGGVRHKPCRCSRGHIACLWCGGTGQAQAFDSVLAAADY